MTTEIDHNKTCIACNLTFWAASLYGLATVEVDSKNSKPERLILLRVRVLCTPFMVVVFLISLVVVYSFVSYSHRKFWHFPFHKNI